MGTTRGKRKDSETILDTEGRSRASVLNARVFYWYRRVLVHRDCPWSLWRRAIYIYSELGLRASPFSEGLRRCRGRAIFISDILLPKRDPPRRGDIYLPWQGAAVFVFSSVPCVHAYARARMRARTRASRTMAIQRRPTAF